MPAKSVSGWRWLDKDPVIDLFREAKRRSGLTDQQIHEFGGPTPQTLLAWDLGTTKKPQRLSMEFAMQACGYKEQWVDGKGSILKTTYAIPKTHLKRKHK